MLACASACQIATCFSRASVSTTDLEFLISSFFDKLFMVYMKYIMQKDVIFVHCTEDMYVL